METNFEIIDAYLRNELNEAEKKEVEKRITDDSAFAKDFAFMMHAQKAAKEEAAIQRKKDFESLASGLEIQQNQNVFLQKKRVIWAAAASLALLMGFFWLFNMGESSEKLADNYIKNQLTNLPVEMGSEQDSLQKGLSQYNQKAYLEASAIFEKLASKNPKALEYQGLVALQLEKYEKAIAIFQKLAENQTYQSRAKLLEALAQIKKGDKAKSYELIKSINKKDLSLEDREFIEDLAVRN
jgi:hypothetical protein